MKQVVVGLLGVGTVGSGVVRLLHEQTDRLARRAGARIDLKWAVVRDPEKPRAVSLKHSKIITDPRRVIDDPEVTLIVETMGGTEQPLRPSLTLSQPARM